MELALESEGLHFEINCCASDLLVRCALVSSSFDRISWPVRIDIGFHKLNGTRGGFQLGVANELTHVPFQTHKKTHGKATKKSGHHES